MSDFYAKYVLMDIPLLNGILCVLLNIVKNVVRN